MAKKPNHYVDNKKFLEEMTKYKKAVHDAEDADEPHPRVPEYIGECILKISQKQATRGNFASYPFREEMVNDGIENALRYIDNFDPENSKKNPFGYFSKIIYWAFVRRIKKEKDHLYKKLKLAENMEVYNLTSDVQEHDHQDNFGAGLQRSEWSEEYAKTFIKDYEEAKNK